MPDNKELFLGIVNEKISRPGLDRLLAWLEKTDFYTAPASSRFHLAEPDGLLAHSLNVYNEMNRLLRVYGEFTGVSEQSVAIMALFHDLCKVNMYKPDTRNVKIDGVWTAVPTYTIEEKFPFGSHGGKSVFLLQQFIPLSPEEAVAINCHMGLSEHERSIGQVYEKHVSAWLLHAADEAATFIIESPENTSDTKGASCA